MFSCASCFIPFQLSIVNLTEQVEVFTEVLAATQNNTVLQTTSALNMTASYFMAVAGIFQGGNTTIPPMVRTKMLIALHGYILVLLQYLYIP